MQIFHRDKILNEPARAWQVYKEDRSYFSFPERITIEVTNRCNLQCSMCPRNKVKMKMGDMRMRLFKKIIDEIANFLPACLVPFFRGESFLNPQFLGMLAYAVNKKIKPIQIATNALFLNPKTAKRILNLGVDFISFSVDTGRRDLYNKIRKNSDFGTVFHNILYFLELKSKKGLNFPEIQISAVKTKENEPFIKEFINFWEGKVDRIRIYQEHSLKDRLGEVESKKPKEKRMPCLKVLTDLVIYWDGDVAICNHDWKRDIFIGNVKKESIEEIWNSPAYREIRERHMANDLEDFSPCNYCSHWQTYYCKEHIIGELYAKGKRSHKKCAG